MYSLAARPRLDPLTGGTFEGEATLAPNHTVKRLITEWRDSHASSREPARTVLPRPHAAAAASAGARAAAAA